jgi:hypothetical protein
VFGLAERAPMTGQLPGDQLIATAPILFFKVHLSVIWDTRPMGLRSTRNLQRNYMKQVICARVCCTVR